MILYFTGTCNSLLVAKKLAELLGDTCLPLIPMIGHISDLPEEIGLVFPVYSWGVPPVVLNFVEHMRGSKVKRVRCICTCGDEVAMTPEMMNKALAASGIEMIGIWSVIMPNNYVLLPGFGVDSEELEKKKLDECGVRVEYVAQRIMDGKKDWDVTRGSMPWIKTRLIYPLFKKWGTTFGKWHADTDSCIGCGKCAKTCPAGNILMKDGRPEWGDRCLSCVSCFHICPVRAIDYSSYTKGKGQYSTLFSLLLPKCREDR